MFRILQGDVGSGKTIVACISAINSVESGYQCGLMAPTSILAEQHYKSLKKLIYQSGLQLNIELLTGKTDSKKRKEILINLENKKIDFLIGTHALFQKTISFKKLGLIIIDEQHKFGVQQRIRFAKKGGINCDVLLLSATPIPRTMMMSIYGDMDTSRLMEKPIQRKKIITLSKPENKIDDLWPFIKRKISEKEQIFWVCPLIEDSNKLDFSSTEKLFKLLNKKFNKKYKVVVTPPHTLLQSYVKFFRNKKIFYQDKYVLIPINSSQIFSKGLISNLGLAIKISLDLGITKETIVKTIPKIKFNGRVQYIKTGKWTNILHANEKLLVDGCHSEKSGKNFTRYKRFFCLQIFFLRSEIPS